MLEALARVARARLRIWRAEGGTVRAVAGQSTTWTPPLNGQADDVRQARAINTPEGPAWLEPVQGDGGFWLEVGEGAATGQEREAHPPQSTVTSPCVHHRRVSPRAAPKSRGRFLRPGPRRRPAPWPGGPDG